jgi:MAternally-affected-uncoordination protein
MVLPPVAFVLSDWCVNTDAEANLEHSTIWTAGLYLMLLLQFLENKVAVELTRSEFVEAQEALAQMINWFTRFPTILRGCENTIEMLRGQYAHSVGCFDEAAFHFLEAARVFIPL